MLYLIVVVRHPHAGEVSANRPVKASEEAQLAERRVLRLDLRVCKDAGSGDSAYYENGWTICPRSRKVNSPGCSEIKPIDILASH